MTCPIFRDDEQDSRFGEGSGLPAIEAIKAEYGEIPEIVFVDTGYYGLTFIFRGKVLLVRIHTTTSSLLSL